MSRSSLFKASGIALAIAAISSGTNAAELEEVIVTAQKRAESLQDVPVSLVAISGTKIEEAGMHSFAELSAYVPNLAIHRKCSKHDYFYAWYRCWRKPSV